MVAPVLDPASPFFTALAFAYTQTDNEWIDSVSGLAASLSVDVTFATPVGTRPAISRVAASSVDSGFLPAFNSDTKVISTYILTTANDNLGTIYAQRTDAEARMQAAIVGGDLAYLVGGSGALTLDAVNNYADGLPHGIGLSSSNTAIIAYRDGVNVGTADITAFAPTATPIQMGTGNRWTVHPTVEFGADNAQFARFYGWNRTLTPAEQASIHANPDQIFLATVPVGRTLDISYAVTEFVGDTVDIRYSIQSFVGNTVDVRYSTEQFIGALADLRYAIEAFVGDTLDVRYEIAGSGGLTPVGRAVDVRYGINAFVAATMDIRYGLLDFVGRPVDTRYAIQEFVGSTVDVRYAITAFDLVGRLLDVRYATQEFVGNELTIVYRIADPPIFSGPVTVRSLDGAVTVTELDIPLTN